MIQNRKSTMLLKDPVNFNIVSRGKNYSSMLMQDSAISDSLNVSIDDAENARVASTLEPRL